MRLVAAALLPQALLDGFAAPAGDRLPLALFGAAAASDFVDGPLARRAGATSRHGAVLDTAADIAFVLAGTVTAAWAGRLPVAVPLAIAVSVGAYLLASAGISRRGGTLRFARTSVGHAAGIANYALVGGVVIATAAPAPIWDPVLRGASLLVIAINVAAALGQLLPGRVVSRPPPAPAPPGGGRRAR